MDTKRTEPENEFTFIQEKVIPRRKNKIKKMVYAFASTILLASVFGLVARIIFVKSEGLINNLLGIDTTPRTEILFPSDGPSGNEVTPSLQPGQSAAVVSATPTINPTPEPTPEVTPVVQPTIVEQKIPASISDYEKILLEIRKLANSVDNSLVTVVSTESKSDWQDEPFESKRSTTGIVLGENSAEILMLVDCNQVMNASEIEVCFSGGFTVKGQIWNCDEDYNLAIIAVKLRDITPMQLETIEPAELGESYSLSLGTPVLAMGQPNGLMNSIELGMITGKGDSYYILDNRLDLFTTDITNNENSNGIILSLDGKVVGLISQVSAEGTNVSTAVGISRLKPVIEKLINKYDRILFGIIGEDIPESVLKQYELESGIYVTKVLQDSPAFNGDIRQGDIIIGINDYPVSSIMNFASILNNFQDGDEITVTVSRLSKGELKQMELKVVLTKKP